MLAKPKKLLSWFLSQSQDWTKGSPANSSMVSLEKVGITQVFWVFLTLVWVYSCADACAILVAVADELLARRIGKVLRLRQAELLAVRSFTTVDVVANPTAVCMAGFQQLYFCLLGRSQKIIFYYCLLFWLSASLLFVA